MALGYDGGKLFILAFDHRGSFQKKMFGIEGDPSEEQTRIISDAKRLIYEGLIKATEQGAPAEAALHDDTRRPVGTIAEAETAWLRGSSG